MPNSTSPPMQLKSLQSAPSSELTGLPELVFLSLGSEQPDTQEGCQHHPRRFQEEPSVLAQGGGMGSHCSETGKFHFKYPSHPGPQAIPQGHRMGPTRA